MIGSLLLACAVLVFVLPANAHPHIFVDADGGFIFNEDGDLTAVRIFWLYDEYSTLFLYDILDLDKDGDGQLSEADLEKIRQGETTWDAGYEGDSYLWIDSQKQLLLQPANTSAHMVKGRIGVSFELQLLTPLDMTGRSAQLKLYDPMYYYAYSIPNEGRIFGNAPDCHVRVKRFTADQYSAKLQKELSALSREDMPEDKNIGAKFAEEIILQCD